MDLTDVKYMKKLFKEEFEIWKKIDSYEERENFIKFFTISKQQIEMTKLIYCLGNNASATYKDIERIFKEKLTETQYDVFLDKIAIFLKKVSYKELKSIIYKVEIDKKDKNYVIYFIQDNDINNQEDLF